MSSCSSSPSACTVAAPPRADPARDTTITTLTSFKDQALARIAAQHDEIIRLRTQDKRAATVRLLPVPGTGPCN